jgi:protein ImuA
MPLSHARDRPGPEAVGAGDARPAARTNKQLSLAAFRPRLEERPPEALRLEGPERFPAALVAGVHQIAGQGAGDAPAAAGFAGALMARTLALKPGARGLWVQAAEAVRETGGLYAPGLQALGLDPDRVGVVWPRTGVDALRVVDEALRSGAVAAVVAELCDERRLDLSVTRRFNLSGRRTGALAFLVTRDLSGTSAALTRWDVAAEPSREPGRRLGRPTFRLRLSRNRLGPTGEWILEWDSHDRVFRTPAPLSAPLARPALHRPGPPRGPEPGLPAGGYRQAG